MKLVSILLSQSGRLGKVSGKGGGNVYGLNLTKHCEQRYGFLESPRTLDDYNLTKGVTFLHGYFRNQIVIDKFQVFEDGFLVESKVDTDICEEFLDDVLSWAVKEGGISFDQALVSPRIFLSHIEVKLNGSLAGSITKISDLGKEIAATMRGYGHDTPDWELTGLSYGNKRPGDVATFKFERREGSPPPEDIYFATSRMRTKDHLRILEILEKLL